MKRYVIRLLLILFAGVFVSAGCAKHEVVKKDALLTPAVVENTVKVKSPETAIPAPAIPPANEGQKISTPDTQQTTSDVLQKMLDKIFFDLDSSALNENARQALSRNFKILKEHPQAKLLVEGHGDERGSDAYNLALGERRARAAVNYLITMGLPADQLSALSYGKEKPADPGHDEAAWAKNRRDEFVIR